MLIFVILGFVFYAEWRILSGIQRDAYKQTKKPKAKEFIFVKEKEDKMKRCEKCGKEISDEEYNNYDGLCWECWDDEMTEEDEWI